MRKRLTLFLLAILMLPIMAACGGASTGTTSTSATTQAPSAPVATEAVVPTEAPVATEAATMPEATTEAVTEAATEAVTEAATAAATEAATEAATAAATEAATTTASETTGGQALKIGLVTDVGKVNDKSFNESAWNGTQEGAKAAGVEAQYIETADANDYAKNIDQFVSEGYNVIVTVGFAIGQATIDAAKANPNVKFIGIDQFQSEDLPNLAGLIFNEDQAGFLAGALAASYSTKNKIGGVLSTDAVPPVWRYGEGYRAGAKYIKPDIDVQIVYHNDVGLDKTFSDPEWGKATALSMMDQGVDVIFGAGGNTGNGALIAVAGKADSGVVAIGVDTDQYNTVTEAKSVLLSSSMKIEDKGVTDLLNAIRDGSFKGGNVYGEVALAPFHDFDSKVPADVKAKLQEIQKALLDGSLKTNVPPTKPS